MAERTVSQRLREVMALSRGEGGARRAFRWVLWVYAVRRNATIATRENERGVADSAGWRIGWRGRLATKKSIESPSSADAAGENRHHATDRD